MEFNLLLNINSVDKTKPRFQAYLPNHESALSDSSLLFFLGTCVDLVNSYSCSCAVGFNGTNCDKIITSCTNDSCYSNVTCYENNQTISCGPCPPGLTGNGKNYYGK